MAGQGSSFFIERGNTLRKKQISDQQKLQEPNLPTDRMPIWLLFLAYLAYLRATQPQRPPELALLRTLILATMLILIVVALVVAGDPKTIPDVLQHLHLIP